MGNYIYHLIHEVVRLDNHNTYVIFVSEQNKQFFRIRKRNVHLVNLGRVVTNNIYRGYFEQFVVPRLLKRYTCDLYHNPGFTLPTKKTMKHIVTIADMTYFSHPEYHIWWKVPYFRWMIPKAINNAERVIVISESTKKDILKYVPGTENKIKIIYLGLDARYKIIDKKVCRKKVAQDYSLNEPFIVSVGMLEPRKNIVGLLKAFAQVKTAHKLVIIGEKGWMYNDIFETIKKLHLNERVRFLGYIPDEVLPSFYNAATVFIYPSFYEGFGLPVLEAMACGCPVITSNNSSMKEIAHDAALLVEPDNVQDIAYTMNRLLRDEPLQKALARKGFTRSRQFSWGKMAHETIALYEEVYSEK